MKFNSTLLGFGDGV